MVRITRREALAAALAAIGSGAAAADPFEGRIASLRFREEDLPGFTRIQGGKLDWSGFTHLADEARFPYGTGWEQKWRRPGGGTRRPPAFVHASVLGCASPADARDAARQKMSGIAAFIEWQSRLPTGPAPKTDTLWVQPRSEPSYGVYQVFGTAGRMAFHIDVHKAGDSAVSPGDARLVDDLVRKLVARYLAAAPER